jgi:heme O synthase-like polyprenyltransferase
MHRKMMMTSKTSTSESATHCGTVSCILFHKLCNDNVTIMVVLLTDFRLYTVLLKMAKEANITLGGYRPFN